MTVTKELIKKQVKEIRRLRKAELKDMTEDDQIRDLISKRHVYTGAVSRVFRKSGRQIGEILKSRPGGKQSRSIEKLDKSLEEVNAKIEARKKRRELLQKRARLDPRKLADHIRFTDPERAKRLHAYCQKARITVKRLCQELAIDRKLERVCLG